MKTKRVTIDYLNWRGVPPKRFASPGTTVVVELRGQGDERAADRFRRQHYQPSITLAVQPLTILVLVVPEEILPLRGCRFPTGLRRCAREASQLFTYTPHRRKPWGQERARVVALPIARQVATA